MAKMTIRDALEQGLAHQQAGRLQQAEEIYRQILSAQPRQPDALRLLGQIAFQTGRLQQAADLARQAIQIDPTFAEYHNDLGQVLMALKQPIAAIESYQTAIALSPGFAEAHNNLGTVYQSLKRLDEAVSCYRQAISLRPRFVEAMYNLGFALVGLHRPSEALEVLQQVIELNPDLAVAHEAIGDAYWQLRDFSAAAESFHRSSALDQAPRASIYLKLGNIAHISLQPQRAIEMYRRAVQHYPDWPTAHYNLAIELLLSGQFALGWREHEWRWLEPELGLKRHPLPQPMWNGSDICGRSIVLECEQGFGDTIQFARYAPLLTARGARVTIISPVEMIELMRSIPNVERIITEGDPFPDCQVRCPLMSLPLLLKTDLDSIPGNVPYMKADPARVEFWRNRIDAFGSEPRKQNVGIAWAGRPTHTNDFNRSISLDALAPLAEARNVRFFSLQKGAAASQARQPPPGMELIDWTDELRTFDESAGLIANLDLVIAVDTAVVHLAGAMGKPVWLLLPFVPDWRWLLNREDSPWYPTMRLFRQVRPRDWSIPVARVLESLRQLSVEP